MDQIKANITMQTPTPSKKLKAVVAAVSVPKPAPAALSNPEPELIHWSEVIDLGRRIRAGEHTLRKWFCLPGAPYAAARIKLKSCSIARYNRRMVLEAMGLADSAGPVQ